MINSFEDPLSERRPLLGSSGISRAALVLAEPAPAVAQGVAPATEAGIQEWHDPVHPDPKDPARLVRWQRPKLTLGGKLSTLALNYAFGRSWTGIHWRSDAAAAFTLGEEVAIALLREQKKSFTEPFEGFAFTRFDSTRVTL
jgi:hypothetical protein